MFLAIINDTYIEVKAELRNKKNEFEISDFVKQGYTKMRERLTVKRDRITDIRKALALADLNRDKRLEFDEWRTEMKSRGYAEEEIESIFAKYDLNGDRVLDENEQRALTNDLLRQNNAILREMDELNMSKKNKYNKKLNKTNKYLHFCLVCQSMMEVMMKVKEDDEQEVEHHHNVYKHMKYQLKNIMIWLKDLIQWKHQLDLF
jgi:polycystin 2